jgi:amino acid transporter
LTTFTNFTGDAGGGVIPATGSLGLAFFFGLIYVCYTITGFDASAHTSEETHDAQVNVPKGMWTAVFWSWVVGFVMVCLFVLTMPSIQDGAKAGGLSFFYVWSSSTMPSWLSILLAGGIVFANYLCGLAGLTSASRMTFAFARDGGLPASKTLSHVSTQYRTPTYAIWTAVVVAILSTVYADAFLVLATGCAVFLYLSYAMPIIAGFFAEGKTWKEKGPFNLGIWSKPNAILATIGAVILAITGFFPPNQKVFYLTVAMVVVMVIMWYGFERNRFEGVPEGDKIKENQKKIAEIEKKYKD